MNRFALSLLRVFKKPIPDVFRDEVMNPIGASTTWKWVPYTNAYVDIDGKRMASVSGGTRWGGGMWINSYDMARFGLLWLRNGKWGDKQIVPPAYVKMATTPSAHGPDYGFLWWLNTKQAQWPGSPANAFSARGTAATSSSFLRATTSSWCGGGARSPTRASGVSSPPSRADGTCRMNLAYISLAALVVAILVSCFTELNVGILALALAWVVGVYVGGMPLNDVIGGFPVSLFLTLSGVTLLFAQAQQNRTLDRIAHRAVRVCRGNAGLIPIMFFALGCALASMGPGNVSTAALLGPMAMAVAGRAAIPAFLMIIMVGNGAQAGALSPFAPTGVIVNGLMVKIGLPGHEWFTYWTNLAAHAAVAFGGYALFGGLKLFKSSAVVTIEHKPEDVDFDRGNFITIAVIAALLVGVLFFGVNVGMGAFAGAVILAVLGAADHKDAIKRMPWSVIVMMSGVTVLIALMEDTGGLDLFTAALARLATPGTITGVIAFVTGLISVYSSTSGVVLPAFLPTIPGLIERLGGGDPLAIAASMNIGAHLVDLSPLSTTGALCIAAVASGESVRSVFNKLLIWGLSMTIVGGVFCYIFF